ncbi:unnamed protein product [Malus baccata var. baccata]
MAVVAVVARIDEFHDHPNGDWAAMDEHWSTEQRTQTNRLHPESAEIYEKLKDLLTQVKSIVYIPNTGSVFHLSCGHGGKGSHGEHSRPESPIRVVKNLRTCDDWTAIVFVSLSPELPKGRLS